MNARQILMIILLLFAAGTQAAPTLLQSSDLTPVLNVGDQIVLSAKFAQAQAVRWTVNGDIAQTDRNRRRGQSMLSRFAFSAQSAGITAIRATAIGNGETTVDWQVIVASAARVGPVMLQLQRSPQDNVQVAEGGSQTFSVRVENGTPPFQYAWMLGANPVGTASSFAYQPDFDTVAHPAHARTLSLTCAVADSLGGESATTWTVTVTDVDRAPALPAVSVIPQNPKTTDDLALSIQQVPDPDGDTVFYDISWSALAAREAFPGATLDATHTRRDETWQASVTVVTNPYAEVPQSNPQPVQSEATIANSAPVAESAEIDILQNESRLLILPGSDADDGPIRFEIVRHPDFGELRDLDAATGQVTYLADPRATGRTVIRYRVTDDRGESAVGMLTLTVAGWTLPIEVAGAEELLLGMARNAQTEQAPPDVRTTLAERLMRDIREEADDAIWELVVEGDVLVKWNVDHVPDTGLFLTPIDGPGQSGDPAATVDMSQVNSIRQPGRYRIRHAIFEYDMVLRSGWQLIGFPFDPLDDDVTLGGRVQEILHWGEDYMHAQQLGPHSGYFAFVPGGGATVRLAGRYQRKMAGTLQDGWNLVSLALPPGTREITYAQFLAEYPQASNVAWALVGGQYRVARVLRKGVSYWIYVEPDMSGLGPLSFDELPEDQAPANAGALEGGVTGTAEDAAEHNSVAEAEQIIQDIFEVPTNGPPSPLFAAAPFSQQMLRFEEFGTEALDLEAQKPQGWQALPAPADAQSVPPGSAVEQFLEQALWPLPTVYANTTDRNPWEVAIEQYLGRDLAHPPAEGRPPGIGWSHQRWEEFTPQRYFQTAMTGAHTNGGFRDAKQRHGYSVGEFGPGGLYHNTAGASGFDGTTAGIEIRFHPNCRCRGRRRCGPSTAPCRRSC